MFEALALDSRSWHWIRGAGIGFETLGWVRGVRVGFQALRVSFEMLVQGVGATVRWAAIDMLRSIRKTHLRST